MHGAVPVWRAAIRHGSNGSDRDDVVGDNISGDMSNTDQNARMQRAHVRCIIGPFGD
jgi:hypothetical protein